MIDSQPLHVLNKTAILLESHQDAALFHLLQAEGGSTSRMKTDCSTLKLRQHLLCTQNLGKMCS